ncbi:MAG: PqiC family protein [Acetobacteraceae bacterium]
MKSFGALAFLLLLAGCAAAPPITYLQLAPVAGPAARVTRSGPPIRVAQVEMPPAIDRLGLTRETGTSTLAVDPNASWAAPLDGMATQVLAENLASRLPGTKVLMPGEVMPRGTVRVVRVDVLRFLPIAAAGAEHVALDAYWQVVTSENHVAHSGHAQIRVASAAGAPAEAAAMSHSLGELADQIAAAVAR